MESEPPDGNDYNDALNGQYSFWRWREWIICLGAVKAYEEMGHKAAIALSRNMTTYNLPDCFTEKPTSLLSRVGEAIMRNQWKTMDPELVNDWNEGGSKPRRTELKCCQKWGSGNMTPKPQ